MDNPAGPLSAPGCFAEVDGTRIHWREWGSPNALPTIVLECGLTMMSAAWGWLGPMLGRETRVLAWDRPGLGWSQARQGIRAASRIADELLEFLKQMQLRGPVVLAGHSLGALIARATFAKNPELFAGMIWLDGAHPKQMDQPKIRRRMRNFFLLLEGASLIAAQGLPAPPLPIASELEHLPERERVEALHFLKQPEHLRASAREARAWKESADAPAAALRNLPLLVISAQKHALPGWNLLQNDLALESERSEHVTFTDATHISLISRQQHAERVADTALGWLRGL